MSYDLAAPSGIVSLPAGTSLLVTAPAPDGRQFVKECFAHGLEAGEEVLVLTADEPAGEIGDDLRDRVTLPDDPVADPVQIIDCQTDQLGTTDQDIVNRDVNTPRNLADIGIAFKNAFDRFDEQGVDRVRFGVLSLSIILSYVDRETGYRFCQTLTRGLAQEDALGLFVMNENAHDTDTIDTLKNAFDGHVEIDYDDSFSVRISGIDNVSEEWISLGK
jgi:hypothetical protein